MPKKGSYSSWPEETRQAHRAAVRRWRTENPEKHRAAELLHNEKRRLRYATDSEYREKILTNKVWKDTMRLQQKRRREGNKKAVFDHYGRVCVCCGETQECFLSIDHINNNGAEHRRSLSPNNKTGRGAGSSLTYSWLVKHNFPTGFQTLCQNCNSGKARCGGVCPHELARTATLPLVSEPE